MKTGSSYRWTGLNAQGRAKTGTLYAINKQQLATQLKQQGITVIKATRQIGRARYHSTRHFELKFTSKLASLLSKGIDLKKALSIMQNSNNDIQYQYAISHAIHELAAGNTLSHGLKKTQLFSKYYLNMIQCAEHSCQLTQALSHLETHLRDQQQLRRQIKKALRYPCLVLVISLFVVVGLLCFVIPQFESTFMQNGRQLPALTQFLLSISTLIRQHNKGIVICLSLFMLCTHQLLKHNTSAQYFWHFLLFNCPLIKSYYRIFTALQLTQTLHFCLSSGMTLYAALTQFHQNHHSDHIKKTIKAIMDGLHQGKTFSDSVATQTLFSPDTVDCFRIAEQTNALTSTCALISSELKNTLDEKTHSLTELIEPVLMVILSIIIGTVIIAMYMPLFQLGRVIV